MTRSQDEVFPPLKPTHYLILLLLADRPTHGVELLDRIEERSGGSTRLNAGSLYRLVAQLLELGFIEPLETVMPEGGQGAPRKRYGVTRRGRAAVQAESTRQADLLALARSLDLSAEG